MNERPVPGKRFELYNKSLLENTGKLELTATKPLSSSMGGSEATDHKEDKGTKVKHVCRVRANKRKK